MRIAIPITAGRLCMHFGHCKQFALVDIAANGGKATQTTRVTSPPHEPGLLPRWLHQQGATVIIAGGIGQRARQLLDENGVTVVVGAPAEAPEALVSAYLNGTLQCSGNTCGHEPQHHCPESNAT